MDRMEGLQMDQRRNNQGLLFYLAAGIMELSCYYGFVFIFNSILPLPFSFSSGVYSYLSGFLLTRLDGFFMRWQSLLLHLFTLSILISPILYPFTENSVFFWKKETLVHIAQLPSLQQGSLALLLLFILIFFWGGSALTRRSTDYTSISSRFDLGVFLLFLIFFFEGIGGIEQIKGREGALPLSAWPILTPFFFSSLVAITLSRGGSVFRERKASGSPVLLLYFLLLILVVGGISSFQPFLKEYAQEGVGLLEMAAETLTPILIRILRFLFTGQRRQGEWSHAFYENGEVSLQDVDGGAGEIPAILLYGLTGLLILILVFLLGWLLLFSIRWFRCPRKKREWERWNLWESFLYQWWMKFLKFWKTRREPFTPTRLFQYLLGWGKRSGYPRRPGETPKEYGLRLQKNFPQLEREVECIIFRYHQEAFGGVPFHAEEELSQKRIYRKLKNPSLWPVRFFNKKGNLQ